ncbi:MAG: family 78 glycoside hydrolase catalytic domain [Fimbriimonadaceae bacterium]|nr:family 78 glycoside hydrolase catalytic domain [Fimbriimonadaceae bacterium]
MAGPVGMGGRGAPVHLVEQAPKRITRVANGFLVDFGRVAFGNLRLSLPLGASGTVTVHFGEALVEGRVDRHPPGSVRYARAVISLDVSRDVVVAPPADQRNTAQPAAVLTPPEWGVVLPFRWVEIEGWPGELRPEQVRRRAAFASTWDDDSAAFDSSDPMLNQIWELCRYSIKATTFAGVYVDGDRERISYEGDSYLNQLSQYATDGDVQMARDTFDRLMKLPTWPTEWASHMIFIAHADWMQTGDARWLASRYEALKTKLLVDRARADGLVVSTEAQQKRDDLVDWPAGERDGFVFTPVNTVVNAFHLRSLALMADLARALQKDGDAAEFEALERKGRAAFQRVLFDGVLGLYRDGEGTDHNSLHSNLFPLAFGLVPVAERPRVARWLAGRGMACSVYAAQYLMEALFENGEDVRALALMTADGDRSWRHMVESGTTITWEAWDQRYKPNQDWNHAWGAAPANLLPRYVLGVQALTPGWGRASIRPHPGGLKHAEGKVPTPRGPVSVRWSVGTSFKLSLGLPPGLGAQVRLPEGNWSEVRVNGNVVSAHRDGVGWVLDNDVVGKVEIEARE